MLARQRLVQPEYARGKVPGSCKYLSRNCVWRERIGIGVPCIHLEARPVRPQCAANPFGGEAVGQLVGFHAVMERSDLEAEFLGQVAVRRAFFFGIRLLVIVPAPA